MVGTDFEVGDLVWAKMKNYPFWPAKIVNPPSNVKSTPSKKSQHYVFFFGSENYAWILDENIVHHSEEMLQSNSNKKKSTTFKSAIDKIMIESESVPFKSRPLVKEKEKNQFSESPSVSKSGRKDSKSQRSQSKYEIAKKKYFAKVQKASQNQYFAKMQKKMRKKYMDRIRSRPKGIYNLELNGANYQGVWSNLTNRDIPSTDKKIGFLGMGKMGRRCVKELLAAKHKVTVWNRTVTKCSELVKLGAECALSVSSVVAECDIIFCCVSGQEAVKSIVFGHEGVLAGLEGTRGKGYVEMSTLDPVSSEEIAEAIRQKNGIYLESPITETKKENMAKSVAVICAGDFQLFHSCESCFQAFATDVYYLGSMVGTGSKLNLLVSMFTNTVYAALAESLALIRKLNLEPGDFLEFFKNSPLNCSLLLQRLEDMTSNNFFVDKDFKYQQRDLSYALALGDSCEQPMPLTASANELYKRPIHILYNPENGLSAGVSNSMD